MHREVVVAGNYSHDTLLGEEERSELGGSSAYVSAVLRAGKVDFAVVANVGDDFRYPDRVPPARLVPGARTTSFVDDYRTGERIATLRVAAPPLQPDDLRDTCEVGMAVAVAAEIPFATLLRLARSRACCSPMPRASCARSTRRGGFCTGRPRRTSWRRSCGPTT